MANGSYRIIELTKEILDKIAKKTRDEIEKLK